MDFLILIDGEMRSLIRNSLERTIGSQFNKKKNAMEKILLKLGIRVISSLIAIQIYNQVKGTPMIKEYASYIMIAVFLFFCYKEFIEKK